jgi:predicted O-methyltransferase YrrM
MENISNSHAAQADKSWGDLYYHVISGIINEKNYRRGAELGVAFGGHAEHILKNTDIEKLYGVDLYENYSETTDAFFWNGIKYQQNNYDDLYNFTLNRMSPFEERFSLIRKTTTEAASDVNEELDFVFIDALHTDEGVTEDLNYWFPKVRRGGMISGHDYNHSNFPGVSNAVNRFASANGLDIKADDGHVWWAIKE